jgi:Ca2+-binding RTX toxin-like protein
MTTVSFAGTTGSASLSLATAADGASDTATTTLGSVRTNTNTSVTSLTVGGFETLSVTSTGAAAGNTISALAGTKLATVNIDGDRNMTLTVGAAGAAVTKIDASKWTGTALNVSTSTATTAAGVNVIPGSTTATYTITGGAGADTLTGGALNDSLTGGDGNDVIAGGEGAANTLVGGNGADLITSGAGNDIIDTGDGNDTVSAGAGTDTITVGAGADSIDAGAGADTIVGATNIDSTDVIGGGDGTDVLTATFSGVGQTPTLTSIETVNAAFGASTFLSMSKADSAATTIRVESASATAVGVTVRDIATGATVTLTDDATTGVVAGDLGAVTLDTVAAATLTARISGNTNATTATATTLGGLTISDAATVTISTTGGTASTNVLSHDAGALVLDDKDTTSLTISTGSGSGFTGSNNITGTDALTSLTLTAASFGDIAVGAVADATSLTNLSLTATGENADISLGAVGGGGGLNVAALTTLSMTATGGATIATGAITSNANMDSITVSASGFASTTGTVSAITPGVGGSITTGDKAVNLLTMTATDRGSVVMANGDLIAGSGLVAAITASATERGSLNLSGFKSDSTATGVAGTYQFSTATRGTLTMDANTSITTDGNLTGLSLVVNSDSTFAGATGATVSGKGTISTTTLTVATDATTSGELTLGEVTAVHTDATVTLSELANNSGDFNLVGATFTKLTLNLDGGQSITAGTIADAGGAGADYFRVAFDGNAEAIDVYNNTTEATITDLVINAGSTTAANTLNVSYASRANVTSGSGADNITGTAGADTINGGAGVDTIAGGTGADVLSGGSGADRFDFAAGDSGTISGTVFDTITDYTIGTSADTLNLVGAAAAQANATGTDVKAAITGGAGTEVVTASIASGIITITGANASAIDTLAEWLAVARLMVTGDTKVGAFVFSGDTYVYQENTGGDLLIKLTGVTTATAIGTSAAATTILVG